MSDKNNIATRNDGASDSVVTNFVNTEIDIAQGESYLYVNKYAFVSLQKLNNYTIDFSKTLQLNKNPLYGKLISYNGDSICQAVGYADGYAGIIAINTGSTFENRAIGGATISSGTGASHIICNDVSNMNANADLICFEGGINDYWDNVPIGTLDTSSASQFINTIDTTTFAGALESIFRQSQQRWYGKPICFIITHKISNPIGGHNIAGLKYDDYYNMIVAVCEKYSIPYVDLYKNSGMNCGIDIIRTTYTRNSGDGTHPNQDGYAKYYVPQITALLKSIIANI